MAGTSTEQLDLFADLDAAAEAVAEAERQRVFDTAPPIFGDTVRGFFARVRAAREWDEQYGHFDCLRRSHAWRDEIGGTGFGRGRIPATDQCQPVTLTADLRCEHYNSDCSCVGDLVYRGACLHCAWEGEIGEDHNAAVEDAHDHAWSGWRDLPIVDRRPEPGTSARQQATMASWVAAVNDVYPAGWLESGGPIRTVRGYFGTRHVPAYTGFGGYDLCGEVRPDPDREPVR
ncbi:DUF6349 family protein [Jatrophihabitans lederbergiae]|uniref:DUF6349 family protein n=1 Tax=Jatrophihabitans lederbergiae TaxID=3075547 RepID=A0ABU2JBD5_9ACTN|nr:DUF6349 family protein [Jatrophihabitans sp. DSM 44399]MDT0262300.1 DUF6349 family protein [Jatrophihabitans sp. DSM 44399]